MEGAEKEGHTRRCFQSGPGVRGGWRVTLIEENGYGRLGQPWFRNTEATGVSGAWTWGWGTGWQGEDSGLCEQQGFLTTACGTMSLVLLSCFIRSLSFCRVL